MNTPNRLMIFAFGCLGALAPEVLGLYKLRNRKSHSWSWYYVVVSIAFAALGGTIAVILPATTYRTAFYAGVSMPLIIGAILRNAGAGQMSSAVIEQTRKDIRRRADMTPTQAAKEETGEAAGSVGDSFSDRRLRLLIHDYINSV